METQMNMVHIAIYYHILSYIIIYVIYVYMIYYDL